MPLKQKSTANGMTAQLANVAVGTVLDNLTATGTNQATAYVLTLDDAHVFRTVGSGTGAVFQYLNGDRLVYAPGDNVTITNFGANTISIYPATGGKIENGSTNAPFTFAANQSAFFQSIDGLNWIAGFLPGTGGGGLGTVTSVAMTGDGTVFNSSVTGSPVTTSGTLAPSLHTQTAHTFLAGPASGSPAAPTFRAVDIATTDITGNLAVSHLNSGTNAGATTFWRGDGTWVAVIPKWYGGQSGVPTASQVLFDIIMTGTETFSSNFTGSLIKSGTAATSSAQLLIKKNGSSVGHADFSAAATTGSFTLTSSPLTFASGDHWQFYAPSSPDATLADVSYTFVQS